MFFPDTYLEESTVEHLREACVNFFSEAELRALKSSSVFSLFSKNGFVFEI